MKHSLEFFSIAVSPASRIKRVAQWIAAPPPDHFVLIDPDAELRQILLAEIGQITNIPVAGASLEDCASPDTLLTAIPLCRPSKAKLVRAALPAGVELVTLPIRSPNAWLNPWLPAPAAVLIGIASHWPEFLSSARTMLIAAGLPTESLVFRDARKPRWHHGLEGVTAILSDAFTGTSPRLPKKPYIIIYRLLADTAAAELASYLN